MSESLEPDHLQVVGGESGRYRFRSGSLEAPFSPNGFARLQLQVDQPLTLATACGPDGLDLS